MMPTYQPLIPWQLNKRDLTVEDITTDFSDGIKLIVLLEILTGNSLGKYSKKPIVTSGTQTTVARQAQYVFRQNLEKAIAFCHSEGRK
jgi:hypothetical protein